MPCQSLHMAFLSPRVHRWELHGFHTADSLERWLGSLLHLLCLLWPLGVICAGGNRPRFTSASPDVRVLGKRQPNLQQEAKKTHRERINGDGGFLGKKNLEEKRA